MPYRHTILALSLVGMFAQLGIVAGPRRKNRDSSFAHPLWMDVPSRKRPAFAGMTEVVQTSLVASPVLRRVESQYTTAPFDTLKLG